MQGNTLACLSTYTQSGTIGERLSGNLALIAIGHLAKLLTSTISIKINYPRYCIIALSDIQLSIHPNISLNTPMTPCHPKGWGGRGRALLCLRQTSTKMFAGKNYIPCLLTCVAVLVLVTFYRTPQIWHLQQK